MKISIILLSALFVFASTAVAEEGADYEEWMTYKAAFGVVKVISVDGKVLTLEDRSADEVDGVKPLARFEIAGSAETEGVESVREIKEGDQVDIEYYITSDGKKVIDFIAVEVVEEDDEIDILLEGF